MSSRADLLDELEVALLLGRADVVALALLDVVAEQRPDELVAAHADRPVDPPHRRVVAVRDHRPVPGDRVEVVGVDERAVDVQDRRGRGHFCALRTSGNRNHRVT
jgi:hypothetical protein